MKKRIYKSMLLLALTTILLTCLLISGVLYKNFYHNMQNEVRNDAFFISTSYNLVGKKVFSTLSNQQDNLNRITWIAADGRVLFDNFMASENMENHLNRPEVYEALENGFGEGVHFSKTLGTQTFYHAISLDDGTILRVSATTKSVFISVFEFIPYIALISLPVIFLTMIIANLLTKKIILPLNNLDLENPLSNDIYDELSPLLSKMARQNDEIIKQFKKLDAKQEEFNTIMENISEGIIVLNNKGLIYFINKSAASIFDVSIDDIINKHILTLDRSISLQKAIKSALDGNLFEDIFTIGKAYYNLLASPVKEDKNIKGVILFILDVTQKKSAEKMRREFSANVSHELKTPLTSILGYAELMKSGMVKAKDITKFSSRIYNEVKHLINLIDDVIQISRLDEKNVDLPFENVDLLTLAKDTLDRLSPLSEKKQIKVMLSGENATVFGVRQILEELIYNLCDNAIKYNYEKGNVDVSVKKLSKNVILEVSDNGFGIPKEHQSRIFERFYRVDKSHSRETGGTGLGLSIVKHSAEFHNAKISLFSQQGKGTKIKVIFKI